MWLTSEICQTSHPRRGYQPNRYHLTPPIVERRSSNTLRVCRIERGTWPRKLDETTDKLCDGVSQPEAEDQAQGGSDRRKRRRLFRVIWRVLQGGGEAGHSGCFVGHSFIAKYSLFVMYIGKWHACQSRGLIPFTLGDRWSSHQCPNPWSYALSPTFPATHSIGLQSQCSTKWEFNQMATHQVINSDARITDTG